MFLPIIPSTMAAFANMEEDRGRQVDITSAGGNNATRRQGGSAKRWGGEGGGAKEGEKGLFPREGTICRENFKNATPWSVWNEISQRILIRLRPEGRGGSIQIIWPSRPPPLVTEEGFLRVPLPRKTHLVRLSGRRYPLDEISRTTREDASRDRFWRLLDRRTCRRLVSIYSRDSIYWWALISLREITEKSLYYLDN